MRKDILNAWISEMRSGQYKQSQSFKEGKDGYCPLGILAKVNNFEMEPFKADKDFQAKFPSLAKSAGKVLDSSRWDKQPGINWPEFNISDKIILLNAEIDKEKKMNLLQIADWVEQHVIPIH